MSSTAFGVRTLQQPAFRRLVVLTLVAVVGLFRAVQLWQLAHDRMWAADVAYYWTAAQNLLHGEPLYSAAQLGGAYHPEGQLGFLYPPPFAVAAIPLALMFPDDGRAAGWVWAAIGFVIVLASCVAVIRRERLGERLDAVLRIGPGLAGAVLLAMCLVFTPVIAELSVGNVHLELLGLFSLAWLGVRRGDAKGERIAGAAVGVAAIIKIFPGLLVLWFLVTGRRTAAAWMLIGAAAVALVTLPVTGLQAWLDYPRVLANMGQILDTHDSVAPAIWLMPLIGFALARWVVLGAAAVLIVVVARSRSAVVSFAVAIILAVIAAPAVFHHYLAILVLPLLLAVAAGVPWRYVGLAWLLMWGGQQPALGEYSWILSRVPQTLGYVVLAAALIWRPRPATDGPPARTEGPIRALGTPRAA